MHDKILMLSLTETLFSELGPRGSRKERRLADAPLLRHISPRITGSIATLRRVDQLHGEDLECWRN